MNCVNCVNSVTVEPKQKEGRKPLPPELLPYAEMLRRATCHQLPHRSFRLHLGHKMEFVTSNVNRTLCYALESVLADPQPWRVQGLVDCLRMVQQALEAPPSSASRR